MTILVSGIALGVFIICGFIYDVWGISWIVYLVISNTYKSKGLTSV